MNAGHCSVSIRFDYAWCRDERCDRLDLHPAHAISLQEGQDFSEKLKEEARAQLESKSKRPPWRRPCPKALDHSIAKAVSKTYPKHLDAILREVEDDYGLESTPSALYRNVQRHLAKLVERGQILRVDLGRRLYAYLRPGSPLVHDVEMMREQIESLLETA